MLDNTLFLGQAYIYVADEYKNCWYLTGQCPGADYFIFTFSVYKI